VFDAYVRTSALEIAQLRPQHSFSEADREEIVEELSALNRLTGTTEWFIPATRTITLAWEWVYDQDAQKVLADWESLRTNLMITHNGGVDQGVTVTQWMVEALMLKVGWDMQVLQAVLPASRH
jgi:hypothetical protein